MFGFIIAALLLGGLLYLGFFLSLEVLKTYRKSRASKIIIANASETISKMAYTEKNKFSMSDLEAMNGKQIIAEYNPIQDKVVQIQLCDKGIDERIEKAINQCGGYIVVED